FKAKQHGNEIRVVDADCSTYTGKIEQVAKSAELDSGIAARRDFAKQKPKYAAKAVSENKSATPQSYFRTTGYNVSLKRRLVFEGNYAAPTQQHPTTDRSNDRQPAQESTDPARIEEEARGNG